MNDCIRKLITYRKSLISGEKNREETETSNAVSELVEENKLMNPLEFRDGTSVFGYRILLQESALVGVCYIHDSGVYVPCCIS